MGQRIQKVVAVALLLLLLSPAGPAWGEETLFEDDFKDGLSDKWQIVGLEKSDYRLRDGGLELRVQPGELTGDTPMLKVIVPFPDPDPVIVSVKVTVLDKFTQDGELAGVQLLDEDGSVFTVSKERQDGKLIYTPGEVAFIGEDGEEGDATKYKTYLIEEEPEAGPLRILVDHGYAFFQVGPSAEGKYHNHFYCAIRSKPEKRGFALFTTGAPDGLAHWVRFEDFRVFKR